MKFLRIVLVLVLVLASTGIYAAPGLNSIKKSIAAAGQLWEKDAQKAQSLLKQAFADAITWTADKYVDSVREQALFLAISCLSPELNSEVKLAAQNYLQIFPAGRNRKKVNLFLAMAAFADNDMVLAENAMNAAVKASGNLNYSEQTFILSGHFAGNQHRTAEHFIEGQAVSKPSARLKKDLRRFHVGNRLAEKTLLDVAEGRLTPETALAALDKIVSDSWFAKKAPDAALKAIEIRDNQPLAYDSKRTFWCGLERTVRHSSSPQIRLKKLEEFLQRFPQAESEKRFKALVDLYYVYLLEFRDTDNALLIKKQISNIESMKHAALIEDIIGRVNQEALRTEQGHADLKKLLDLKQFLPYDNGVMPVVTEEFVTYLLSLADMIQNKNSNLSNFAHPGWNKVPAEIFYHAAVGSKEHSWKMFSAIAEKLTQQIRKMYVDVVFPLYKPLSPKERIFLAGLAAVEMLPDLGTSLLLEAVTGIPRMYRAEHGLAVLADVYNKQRAHAEAQKVWKTLADLYPQSVWLK